MALFQFELRQKRFAGNQIVQNLPLAPELTINPKVLKAVAHQRIVAALDDMPERGQLIECLLNGQTTQSLSSMGASSPIARPPLS